jgi:hypothetical protein
MIIGIDPGAKGGLCLLTSRGEVVETVSLTGRREAEVAFVLDKWAHLSPIEKPEVFIEKVGYIRGDGAGGSFTFGAVFGLLRGIVLGLGLKPHYVYPMMWQSAMGCLSGGNKNVTKNMAITLFPKYHAERPRGIVHDIADSILIAEYGRRTLMRE